MKWLKVDFKMYSLKYNGACSKNTIRNMVLKLNKFFNFVLIFIFLR